MLSMKRIMNMVHIEKKISLTRKELRKIFLIWFDSVCKDEKGRFMETEELKKTDAKETSRRAVKFFIKTLKEIREK